MARRAKKRDTKLYASWLFLLLAAILFIGIGYAVINSITAEIKGILKANSQEGVFITNVEYVRSSNDANVGASKIENYISTSMRSTVELSKTNPNSEITYKVTVYNSSENRYQFLDVVYDTDDINCYSNENIIFEISDEGYKYGDWIEPKESKDIYITFKYKDGQVAADNQLKSFLNFRIEKPGSKLKKVTDISTIEEINNMPEEELNTFMEGILTNYLGSSISSPQIEKIKFEVTTTKPEGAIEGLEFDASEDGDNSIIGYYSDTNNNELYELTFVSDKKIQLNEKSQFLFCGLENLSEINFNNVTTTGLQNTMGMFGGSIVLQNLDLSVFDTSNVKDMSGMFAINTTTNLDVSKFNTSNVTNMSGMFNITVNIKNLNLSNFDTSKVNDMSYMFAGCRSLESLDLSNFDTSKVTDMSSMFVGCETITNLDLSNFNTSNVTNMSEMFGSSDTITLNGYCINLQTVDLSSFDTSKVTNMKDMFCKCENLTTIYTGNGWNTNLVETSENMFKDSTKLVGGKGTTYDSNHTDKEYARIDGGPALPGYLTDKAAPPIEETAVLRKSELEIKIGYLTNDIIEKLAENYLGTGVNATTIEKVEFKKITGNPDEYFAEGQYISKHDVSDEGNRSILAYYTTSENNTELTNLTIVSDKKIMANAKSHFLFASLTNIVELNLDNFDTSQVTNMLGMFLGISSARTPGMTSIDLSKFDTSNVTDMSSMFVGCETITNLDLSNFDTSNVVHMINMFMDCSALTTIYVSNEWSVEMVKSSDYMFENCFCLVGGQETIYDNHHTDKEYARIDEGPANPGYFTMY